MKLLKISYNRSFNHPFTRSTSQPVLHSLEKINYFLSLNYMKVKGNKDEEHICLLSVVCGKWFSFSTKQ
jgi:hypothetical protein